MFSAMLHIPFLSRYELQMSHYFSDFHYHDVAEWRARGLPLSTSSDDAARAIDAIVAAVVFMDGDPQLGAAPTLLGKALAADPDCVMANVVKLTFQTMGNIGIAFSL